jgi:flagellar biosynthesis repressor protein FlbT
MSKSMHLSLRAGERIFINGAVLRADRKVSIELMNDATILLESHILQVEDATTPLRQLYFVVQALLIDPASAERALMVFRDLHLGTINSFVDEEIVAGLRNVSYLVESSRPFEALKVIRSLFAAESQVLKRGAKAAPSQAS